jgi:hypothetical protein
MHRLIRFALGLSLAANQLVNAITGGRGDQTVSARAGGARANGSKVGSAVCRVLEAADFHEERKGEDHCQKALRHERERAEEKTK